MFGKDPEILNLAGHGAPVTTSSETGAAWAPSYTPSQKKIAQEIASSILELRERAKHSGLYPVMIPLEFAFYEASSAGNRVTVPPQEVERLNQLAAQARKAATENVALFYNRRRKPCR